MFTGEIITIIGMIYFTVAVVVFWISVSEHGFTTITASYTLLWIVWLVVLLIRLVKWTAREVTRAVRE